MIALPYLGLAGKPTQDELALFEMVGDTIRADRFEALAIQDGMLELRGLPAGDYDLWLKRSGERIRIRVVDGDQARPAVAAHNAPEAAGLAGGNR